MIDMNGNEKMKNIILCNLPNLAKAECDAFTDVAISHISFGDNELEAIEFQVTYKGGIRGCVRTEEDMDTCAKLVAQAMPVRLGFGEADEVVKSEMFQHTYKAKVYVK